jgi:hypothetical protein
MHLLLLEVQRAGCLGSLLLTAHHLSDTLLLSAVAVQGVS